MTFVILSTDIGYLNNHKFYQPLVDLENIKVNMPNVPDLRNTLMQLSRIMFQDTLYNQVCQRKISIVKLDLDKFLKMYNIQNTNLMLPNNKVLKFIKNSASKTVKNELEFDLFENKHIFSILYGPHKYGLPVNWVQDVLSSVSFRDVTYMQYAIPNIFEKTRRNEIKYKDAFSSGVNSKLCGPDQLIAMVDDLFDNIMKTLFSDYNKEVFTMSR